MTGAWCCWWKLLKLTQLHCKNCRRACDSSVLPRTLKSFHMPQLYNNTDMVLLHARGFGRVRHSHCSGAGHKSSQPEQIQASTNVNFKHHSRWQRSLDACNHLFYRVSTLRSDSRPKSTNRVTLCEPEPYLQHCSTHQYPQDLLFPLPLSELLLFDLPFLPPFDP